MTDAKHAFLIKLGVERAVDGAVRGDGLVDIADGSQGIAEKQFGLFTQRVAAVGGEKGAQFLDGIGIFGQPKGGEGDAKPGLGGVDS